MRNGGPRGVRALIELIVAETNQAYADSGVIQRLHVVHTAEVVYEETDGDTDLHRLQNPGDGYLDSVPRLRNRYAADLVVLIVPDTGRDGVEYDVCGQGFLTNATLQDAPWAFSVVAGCEALAFAHETGHNMGLRHDRYVDRFDDLRELGPYPYSVGYLNQRMFEPDAPVSSRWWTVMAYGSQCEDWAKERGFDGDAYCQDSGGPAWLLLFSNPNRTYNGDPTGRPGSAPSPSVTGPADARRSLNRTRRVIANYRRAPCLREGAGVRLRASNGQYVVAAGNGGGDVVADRPRPSPWGRFSLVDANGGCVESGDVVSLHTSDGFFLRARRGGGSTLDATAPRATPWARFRVRRHRGSGPVRSGDGVTLQTRSGHYVWAERGGGGAVRADRTNPRVWGRFKVTHIR